MGEGQVKRPAKTRKKTGDPFAQFKQSTREAFAFLMLPDFGFTEDEVLTHPPECSIRYRNVPTGVTVSYEWGGLPSVVLTKLDRQGESPWNGERVGLKFLVMERCPYAIDRFEHVNEADLTELLQDYARLLQECGRDVLTGDFKVFPKLKQLVAAAERKANLEMFGSETGETT